MTSTVFNTKTITTFDYENIELTHSRISTLNFTQIARTFKNAYHKSTKKLLYRELISETSENISLELQKVTKSDLAKIRNQILPYFIFKQHEEYYVTQIPYSLHITSSALLGIHLCAISSIICQRLSASTDENKGCAKVRDYNAKIEDYEWITIGYETINAKHCSFIVIDCKHYLQP